MRPHEEVKQELVRQWIAKANQDLQACATLLEATDAPFFYPSCFHAQQAAEKYFKALLTWRQIEFSKTHDIGRLLKLLETTDPDVVAGLRGAAALTPFGVEIRYPGDQPEPTANEARQALDLARDVRNTILPLTGLNG